MLMNMKTEHSGQIELLNAKVGILLSEKGPVVNVPVVEANTMKHQVYFEETVDLVVAKSEYGSAMKANLDAANITSDTLCKFWIVKDG